MRKAIGALEITSWLVDNAPHIWTLLVITLHYLMNERDRVIIHHAHIYVCGLKYT